MVSQPASRPRRASSAPAFAGPKRRVARPLIVPLVGACVVALVGGPACSLDEEQEQVAAALLQTVEALDHSDMGALWKISASSAQRELLELHGRLTRALEAVDQLYPPDERAEAREALGARLIEGLDPKTPSERLGPALLTRLLDPEAMRLDDKARDGLRARGAVIQRDKATIHTAAGELFTFQREDGAWRSRLIADLLEQSPAVDRLRANADAVLAAQSEARKAWRESRDPRTPNGAYNALRAAVAHAPPDGAVVYTLVDDEARAVLLRALEVARKAQRVIQRKTKRAQRKALYAKHGLQLFVAAQGDRDLLERWALTDGFAPPVDKDDAPDRVVPGDGAASAPADGAAAKSPPAAPTGGANRVILVTTRGRRIPMRRGEDGLWRLGGYAPALTAALLVPAQRALDAVSPPAAGAGTPP